MIRLQELEPMYEWIEENYGDDVGEEGSESWEEAVQAFEDYCENQLLQDVEWYILNQSQVGIFYIQMESAEELLNVHVKGETQFSLLVMLHGHVVASVESYLASTFIHKVTNSENLIRKLVETDPVFSKMKFTLKIIFEKQENLKLIVATYLKDLIFHEFKKVKPMFKNVLDCDFGDTSWFFDAVKTRHHCVHRAGLDKDGNKVDISVGSIKKLIEMSTQLVQEVESKVSLSPDTNDLKF